MLTMKQRSADAPMPRVQQSLFGDAPNLMAAPVRSDRPDPDKVRARMNTILAKARAAETMPWNERDARMWQTIFPNMANWLPLDEAERLRAEFRAQMDRLKAQKGA
jgi:hypothetical protein